MATELHDPADLAELYERDFYAWAKHQATVLRDVKATRTNLPLDLEHLIEEIDDLGNSQLAVVESQLQRVIIHYLKLQHSPAAPPRRKWQVSVIDAQAEIERRLTPSMQPVIEARLERLYRVGRRIAAAELLDHDEREAATSLPETCPYTLDQLLGEDWRPANRHGLVDDPF